MSPDGNSDNRDIPVGSSRPPPACGRCAPPGVCCGPGSSIAEQMTYMGAGQGDYIIETTYRWVGKGKGEFGPGAELEEEPKSQPMNWKQLCGFGSIVALLGIIAWVLISGTAAPGSTALSTAAPSLAAPASVGAAASKQTSPSNNRAAHGGRMASHVAPHTPSAPALRAGASHGDAAPLHFDCEAGFKERLKEWSQEKQTWCCTEQNTGCPEVGTEGSSARDLALAAAGAPTWTAATSQAV